MVKVSEYNFVWPVEGEKAVVFNSFNCATIEMDKVHLDLLQEGKAFELNELIGERKKVAEALVRDGFLLEDYVDEKKILVYRNGVSKHRKDYMNLTIIPTLRCNLKCFYCYQDRQAESTMAKPIQEGIVKYVSKNMEGLKKLHVCWFGGEPLLEWDMICDMSQKLIKLAEENHCEYSAHIVTNGYLFDEEKMMKLKELHVDRIQITIDGPPSIHSKRKGINGDPHENFEKILGIIERLMQFDIKVNVRVNIDKSNMDSMNELLNILSTRPAGKAGVYPAKVSPYTDICRNIESVCLEMEEYSELETDFYKLMLTKGMLMDLNSTYPRTKAMFCAANHINSLTVGPDGGAYKCWNEIGTQEQKVFNITENGDVFSDRKMKMHYINWISCNPFEFCDCAQCKLLPVCMGGCPYNYIEGDRDKPDCQTLKNNLESIIKNNYYCLKAKSFMGED